MPTESTHQNSVPTEPTIPTGTLPSDIPTGNPGSTVPTGTLPRDIPTGNPGANDSLAPKIKL